MIPNEVWYCGTQFYGGSILWKRISAYTLPPKNVLRSATPKVLIGVFGSNTQQGIIYEWLLLASSVIINFILPTSLVVVVIPYDVSRVTGVGTSGSVNNLRWIPIMAVAELSITKGMPSISHKKESLMWSSSVANDLAYRVGIGLYFSRRRIPCCANKFLLSMTKIEAKMNLDQCIIKPLTNI